MEKTITKDRYARKNTVKQLKRNIRLLTNTILRILKRLGYSKYKTKVYVMDKRCSVNNEY